MVPRFNLNWGDILASATLGGLFIAPPLHPAKSSRPSVDVVLAAHSLVLSQGQGSAARL